jgi:hypothetical protein
MLSFENKVALKYDEPNSSEEWAKLKQEEQDFYLEEAQEYLDDREFWFYDFPLVYIVEKLGFKMP